MDKIQVIALVLETTGFLLTFIHIFKNRLSILINSLLDKFPNSELFWTVDLNPDGKDMSISDSFILTQGLKNVLSFGLSLWIAIISIGAIDNLIIRIILIILAIILVPLLSFVLNVILSALSGFVITLYIRALQKAGKGDFIGGLGLSLALIGLGFETYQVYMGSLKQYAFYICGGFLIILFLLNYKVINRSVAHLLKKKHT